MYLDYLKLLFFSFSICVCACNPNSSNDSSPISNPPNKTLNAAKPDFWAFVKDSIAISSIQLQQIKEIHKKFQKKTNAFKDKDKWSGDTNRPRRTKLIQIRNSEIKAILGKDKYKTYSKIRKDWNIKK